MTKIYTDINRKKDDVERHLHNQSLHAKLLYITLVTTLKARGEDSIGYVDFKEEIKPRNEELADFYRSLKFLEWGGLVSLKTGESI